jgi:ribonucleoside-triphosphate reductase
MKVEKRDGTLQDFKFVKIERAVNGVYNSIGKPVPDKVLQDLHNYYDKLIEKYSKNDQAIPIESIQDSIRNILIKRNQIDAAEAFILYRKQREDIREEKSWLSKEITKKMKGNNVENQNANVDEASFGGRMGEVTRVVTKNYALKNCMSKKSKDNHNNNEIYIHDLDSFGVGMHNCLSIPFDKLLENGFTTRQTDVRGANSVNTACQLVAVIFQLQSLQQFGGVSATHLDWTMVPYVRKSFRKHYVTGVRYLRGEKHPDMINIDAKDMSIEHDFYKSDSAVYQYALDMTNREIHQGVEGIYHNLNTLQSRSGNQLPFSSINYGTCDLPEGRMFTKAILECSLEGTGTYGKTSIFPCGIFQYKKGINDKPGTPNYDLKLLALKSTSHRLYPNYANCDWENQVNWFKQDRKQKQDFIDSLTESDYNTLADILKENQHIAEKLGLEITNKITVGLTERPTEYFSTMGCRTVNGLDINALDNFKNNIQHTINGEFDKIDDVFSGVQKDGRGNICPVTIILPTLAMEAKFNAIKLLNVIEYDDLKQRSKNEFLKLLEKKICEAKDMLIERFKYICSQSSKSARFMYDNHTMSGYHEEEGIISALKHGTLVIGQLGLAETLILLIDKDQTTEEGMEFAKQIEMLYNKKCAEFKQEYKLNFGVYYTPAESLCYTAFEKWKAKYGDYPGVTYYIDEDGNRVDKMYFTNSMHVPVYKQMSPFKKIDIESQLTGLSNAGCITYVELSHEAIHNIEALEQLVDYAMEHDIPYFAINLPSSSCLACGYQGDIDDNCPECGSQNIEKLARVTGYLSTDYRHFNQGKIAEVHDRVKHKETYNF